jgi:hypothetical protein
MHTSLSAELILFIFAMLTFKDLLSCNRVCKSWYNLSGDSTLNIKHAHFLSSPADFSKWKRIKKYTQLANVENFFLSMAIFKATVQYKSGIYSKARIAHRNMEMASKETHHLEMRVQKRRAELKIANDYAEIKAALESSLQKNLLRPRLLLPSKIMPIEKKNLLADLENSTFERKRILDVRSNEMDKTSKDVSDERRARRLREKLDKNCLQWNCNVLAAKTLAEFSDSIFARTHKRLIPARPTDLYAELSDSGESFE